jgi:hypothetical protein
MVETGGADSSLSGAVTLTASVDPDGDAIDNCHFEYGTTSSYGVEVPCGASPGAGTNPVEMSAQLVGLQEGTTYHFRIVATNSAATVQGEDRTFTVVSRTPSEPSEPLPPIPRLPIVTPLPSPTAPTQQSQMTGPGSPSAPSVQAAPVPLARLVDRSLVSTPAGTLTIKIACPKAASSCGGEFTLTSADVRRMRKGRHGGSPTLVLASGDFAVPGGASRTLKLRLSPQGRKLLAYAKTVRARVTLNAGGVGAATQTLVVIHAAVRHARGSALMYEL